MWQLFFSISLGDFIIWTLICIWLVFVHRHGTRRFFPDVINYSVPVLMEGVFYSFIAGLNPTLISHSVDHDVHRHSTGCS